MNRGVGKDREATVCLLCIKEAINVKHAGCPGSDLTFKVCEFTWHECGVTDTVLTIDNGIN